MKKTRIIRKKNFTLIELVVVIIILASIASIAVPTYMKRLEAAKVGTAKTQLKLLCDAVDQYKLSVGRYPEGTSGLDALLENLDQADKWDGPYIKPRVPLDPWGNAYIYVYPGENGDYDIICYGADGQQSGNDNNADIGNWEL